MEASRKSPALVAFSNRASPRDSHEILPTIGGGVQVADFTRGFTKGEIILFSYIFLYFLTFSNSIVKLRTP